MNETKDLSLFDAIAVVLRQRWVILGTAVAVAIAVAAWTMFTPRQWSATASFMPQASTDFARSQLAGLAGQFGVDIGGVDTGHTPEFYAHLLKSRALLQEVATGTYTVGGAPGEDTQSTTLPDLIEAPGTTAELRTEEAIEWLRDEAVRAYVNRDAGLVDLEVMTPWPALSAAIAQRLLDLLNAFNLETQQSQAAAERSFTQQSMERAGDELRTAENRLQAFLQSNRAFSNSPELNFEHDRLQRTVATRQQVYTSLTQAYEEARIREVRNTPVITVLELPARPARPDPRPLASRTGLAVIFGLLLGVGLAVMREYWSAERVRQEREYRQMRTLFNDLKQDVVRWRSRKQ